MNHFPDKKNDPFSKLIGKQNLDTTPPAFTHDIIKKLGLKEAKEIKYEPVISRTGWTFIIFLVSGIFYMALSGNNHGSLFSNTQAFQSVMQQSTSAIAQIFSGSAVIILTMACVAGFLLSGVDAYFRRVRLNSL